MSLEGRQKSPISERTQECEYRAFLMLRGLFGFVKNLLILERIQELEILGVSKSSINHLRRVSNLPQALVMSCLAMKDLPKSDSKHKK